MEFFDVYYENKKLNSKPLTQKEADEYVSSCIMNSGFKPQIVPLKNEFFAKLKEYSDLGYDVMLTSFFGKDAIRMVKRYSYVAEKPLVCEQIYSHDDLINSDTLNRVLDFMYNDIKNQEETKTYKESMEDYLKQN